MMIILWVAPALLLMWVAGARLLWANEGHSHVVGIVTVVSDCRLFVQITEQEAVELALDHNTRFWAVGIAADNRVEHAMKHLCSKSLGHGEASPRRRAGRHL